MNFKIPNTYNAHELEVKDINDTIAITSNCSPFSLHFFMTPTQARAMADALLACAEKVEAVEVEGAPV